MITADTRACVSCHRMLPDEAREECPYCHQALCPPHGEWPAAVKKWLFLRLALDFFSPWHRSRVQAQWEQLVRSKIAGRQWGTRIIGQAASPRECYDQALAETAAWENAGKPGIEKLMAKDAA